MIDLIEPMLKKYSKIHNEYQIINNLIDLDINDIDELKSLGPDYVDILERKTKIIEDYENASHMYERIIGLITGIYIDFHRLKGDDVRKNTNQLREQIKLGDNESLANFMLGETVDETISRI